MPFEYTDSAAFWKAVRFRIEEVQVIDTIGLNSFEDEKRQREFFSFSKENCSVIVMFCCLDTWLASCDVIVQFVYRENGLIDNIRRLGEVTHADICADKYIWWIP